MTHQDQINALVQALANAQKEASRELHSARYAHEQLRKAVALLREKGVSEQEFPDPMPF